MGVGGNVLKFKLTSDWKHILRQKLREFCLSNPSPPFFWLKLSWVRSTKSTRRLRILPAFPKRQSRVEVKMYSCRLYIIHYNKYYENWKKLQGGQIYPIHARGVCKYYISAICQTGAKKRWQCYFFMDKLEWQNLPNFVWVKLIPGNYFGNLTICNSDPNKNEMDGIWK